MEPAFYPDLLCHLAPLRPGEAPLPDCRCDVCRRLRQNAPHVPVILSREPYHGVLRRKGQTDG